MRAVAAAQAEWKVLYARSGPKKHKKWLEGTVATSISTAGLLTYTLRADDVQEHHHSAIETGHLKEPFREGDDINLGDFMLQVLERSDAPLCSTSPPLSADDRGSLGATASAPTAQRGRAGLSARRPLPPNMRSAPPSLEARNGGEADASASGCAGPPVSFSGNGSAREFAGAAAIEHAKPPMCQASEVFAYGASCPRSGNSATHVRSTPLATIASQNEPPRRNPVKRSYGEVLQRLRLQRAPRSQGSTTEQANIASGAPSTVQPAESHDREARSATPDGAAAPRVTKESQEVDSGRSVSLLVCDLSDESCDDGEQGEKCRTRLSDGHVSI